MKRAYRVNAYGVSGIIAANTPGQARFHVFRTLDLRGPNGLSGIQVRRAPEHDELALADSTGRCWDESLLPTKVTESEA